MCFQMCWGRCVPKHVIVAIVLNLVKELFNVDWFFGLSQPTFCVATQTKKKKKKCYSWHRITFRSPHSLACACASNPSFPVTLHSLKLVNGYGDGSDGLCSYFLVFSPVHVLVLMGPAGSRLSAPDRGNNTTQCSSFFFYTFSSWIIHSELPDIDTIDSGWRATTAADAGRYVQALSLRTGFYRYFPGRTRC